MLWRLKGNARGVRALSGSVVRFPATSSFVIAWVLVILSIGFEVKCALDPYVATPVQDPNWDVDWRSFNHHLDEIKGLRDTGRWWTGSWCGLLPYWRPLSSYVFWIQRLAWGTQEMLPREIILVALHLCCVAVFGVLLWKMTRRRWLTLLAVWLSAGYRPFPVDPVYGQIESVSRVLSDSKNVPEPIAGIAIMSSLILLLNRRWVAALVVATMGVGFKELVFVTWPLALTMFVWTNHDRVFAPDGKAFVRECYRRNRTPVLIGLAVLLLLLAVHFLTVGPGMGLGIFALMTKRFVMYFGGPIATSLILQDPNPALAGILLYASILITRRKAAVARLCGVLAAMVVGIMLDSAMQRIPWDMAVADLLSWHINLPHVLACLIWLLVAEKALEDRRTVLLALMTSLIASMPTWICRLTLEHTRYLSSFFMEVLVAAALIASVRTVLRRAVGRGLVMVGRDST